MTDWRALCVQLADELERYRPLAEVPDCLQRARAALAQPEPEVVGPTDQELKAFACEWWGKFGFAKDKATCTWAIAEIDPVHFAVFSRDLLARWGRPAPTPAEGEVAELVTALRGEAVNCTCTTLTNGDLRRAADLLEGHHG